MRNIRPDPRRRYDDNDAIRLAEHIMNLLDQGAFTSTYKYAVLLGLMDICMEQTSKLGLPPAMITTRQLAAKVIEIYWPHTTPFRRHAHGMLRQNAGKGKSQAEILRAIERFRGGGLATLAAAKQANPKAYQKLLWAVEVKLIEMPLPKLQRIGRAVRPYLYQIGWDDGVSLADVRAYQRGQQSDFDNRILLQPGVGASLVRLNNLLRPLIHRQWTVKVADINQLLEVDLEQFLFGATRAPLDAVRTPLLDFQSARCFYCEERIGTGQSNQPEVDHFIPWARYPDDGLANLVVAHRKCNNHKRAFLAATDHVVKWLQRMGGRTEGGRALFDLAHDLNWELRERETLGVGAAIYLKLDDDIELWQRGDEFVAPDLGRLELAFGTGIAGSDLEL